MGFGELGFGDMVGNRQLTQVDLKNVCFALKLDVECTDCKQDIKCTDICFAVILTAYLG